MNAEWPRQDSGAPTTVEESRINGQINLAPILQGPNEFICQRSCALTQGHPEAVFHD